ncbi:TPA: Arc family DNA-binding protein [Escherichia coli]|uniref:Arc family DNA-binding protein n=1 Tax=Escherichia coli TaxID=562 RepID=UPI0019C82378|nr:Arc family DNA-binding protein [Escherichia coli]EGD9985259.1 toxin-antitoxin system HicB family antitoxin [Escherichia coli]EGJ6562940.1 Arc family DNA-binding protein [Escherichia coli]HDD9139982.1 Arc family DNA-binding protein [Escherichia coli]
MTRISLSPNLKMVKSLANGRSMNSELLQIVQDALSKPSPITGYRDEAERLADQQAEQFKAIVFETLKKIYEKDLK